MALGCQLLVFLACSIEIPFRSLPPPSSLCSRTPLWIFRGYTSVGILCLFGAGKHWLAIRLTIQFVATAFALFGTSVHTYIMAETKRKNRDDNEQKRGRMKKKKKASSKKVDKPTRRRGPGLPNVLRKEIDLRNPTTEASNSDDEFESDGAAANDVYEYEEALAEEESKKNKRFDPVENYEYELPEDFEDEDIASDDGSADEKDDGSADDKDDEKHSRMLEDITGLPADAFEGKRQRNDIVISEAYPESEYNPSRDILEGESRISVKMLLDPLYGKFGFSKLRKDVSRMERKFTSLNAPLPRSDQEKLERKAANEFMKKDITKWEPLVKRNREAPTIYFDEDTDVRFSTVGAIASEFQPRTDFEKRIASLVNEKDIVEAHGKDGARLLELNEISAEDVRGQQNRLAKMRSLLFHHEMKAKRIKKIKSKTYHRLLKKDRQKATVGQMEMDEEAAKEIAEQQEFKRAEERLTLKHKSTSRWARRAIGRGLNVQDEGTRAAISEQLHQHALLTRKMRSMKDSSDESSEDDSAELSADSDDDGPSVLRKAKKKTLEVLERDEELPNSGVLSLPFMVRGLKKKKEAADEEARLAIQEYESSLKQLGDKNVEEIKSSPVSSGRMVFGNSKKQATTVSEDKIKSDNYYGNSDSEEDQGLVEDGEGAPDQRTGSQKAVNVDPSLFRDESEIKHDQLFESFKDTFKDAQPHKTYEVAIIASNARKKTNPTSGKQTEVSDRSLFNDAKAREPASEDHDGEEGNADSDADSGGQMVDGILSSGPRPDYELPSQEELLRRAFAGDDVEGDFVKEKEEALNEENPEPEKPVLLPGWGQWTHIQKKKGLPSWMLREHDKAKKHREEALKKRKDASLEHVIISEKLDKKAEKLHTKTLPYPYTSNDVFEQSIRTPIGPDFHPVTAVGALNRPAIMKRSGVSIKPIKFEDINPHEKTEGGHKKRRLKPHKGGKGPKGVSHGKAKSKGVQLKSK